ncbi:hypothetical protein [Streptomyces sp. NPDC059881]|uniref:LppU/SCO3897 family protein n=1 Tax=Streptomyces sp. NPDC059881 TaxID=3346986 RepID=UPI0036624701
MRVRRLWVGVVCVLAMACQRIPGSDGSQASGGGGLRETQSAAPSGYGAVFLDRGDCSGRDGDGVHEVPCTSEKAAARVLARHEGRGTDGHGCPAVTDFVLHLSERRPGLDEDGDGSVSQGYACMRNLEPPHPGDPGGGGGPHTVVGDCLSSSRKGQVKETACDGSGEQRPEFEVAAAVDKRSACPPSTDLFVQLPAGKRPVGCARRV